MTNHDATATDQNQLTKEEKGSGLFDFAQLSRNDSPRRRLEAVGVAYQSRHLVLGGLKKRDLTPFLVCPWASRDAVWLQSRRNRRWDNSGRLATYPTSSFQAFSRSQST